MIGEVVGGVVGMFGEGVEGDEGGWKGGVCKIERVDF